MHQSERADSGRPPDGPRGGRRRAAAHSRPVCVECPRVWRVVLVVWSVGAVLGDDWWCGVTAGAKRTDERRQTAFCGAGRANDTHTPTTQTEEGVTQGKLSNTRFCRWKWFPVLVRRAEPHKDRARRVPDSDTLVDTSRNRTQGTDRTHWIRCIFCATMQGPHVLVYAFDARGDRQTPRGRT